jgi:hypothetical protein
MPGHTAPTDFVMSVCEKCCRRWEDQLLRHQRAGIRCSSDSRETVAAALSARAPGLGTGVNCESFSRDYRKCQVLFHVR